MKNSDGESTQGPQGAAEPPPVPLPGVERLAGIMRRLRAPGGCAWDRAQDERSLKSYLLEEAYELLAAIDADDVAGMREELGDVLLQVVFHSEIAREKDRFDFDAVARAIGDKLIRRHPHVFGEGEAKSAEAALARWESIKRAEKSAVRDGQAPPTSILAGVPPELPALLAAFRLSAKAAGVGFDWPDLASVRAKVSEELGELEGAVAAGEADDVREELGDLLFIVANYARKLGVDPEDALRLANGKFARRFHFIEARLSAAGRSPEDSNLAEMDRIWDEAKASGL